MSKTNQIRPAYFYCSQHGRFKSGYSGTGDPVPEHILCAHCGQPSYRSSKETRRSISINKDAYERLRAEASARGLSIMELVERACREVAK